MQHQTEPFASVLCGGFWCLGCFLYGICMCFVVLFFCSCVCVWQVETLEEGTRRWAVAAGAARARRRGGARVRHHAVSNALFA
eukprot:COSAG05_NODE_1573_length_4515_cov_33.607790_2_plen_83_part_00